ncbi:MAG TPA: glutamine--tRNA ligase/YqeY domain fusion protein [Spirochaetota bacterium]|nr:glutamine--tRNA ligase/YqeY domain fusion protein [Spirochaetota bacterium]HPJ35351.1 glutamine--tRNA ligase/YqeY domain fusion protein [Spirochaetota bacterium]
MSENSTSTGNETSKSNFIKEIIKEDLKTGKHDTVATRFPPEPNGYLHIGHAKSICLNFGIANEFRGTCNLRFDDTNPTREDTEYVDSIQDDVRWLGFNWDDRLYYASDYYEQLYEFAVVLIKKGKAYVCDLSPDQMREYRGTLKQPGKESPFRNRSVEENLDLFQRMRNGEFRDGERTLRAKIDMTSGYIVLRDPVLYRIQRAHHHRTGDAWCIYPMYDFAHPLSDSIEGITHSICTLEFENNRPLYDWVVNETDTLHKPRQIEFARLNLSYTVMSKRKLLELVTKNYVKGWDDPRMPTIAGLRRRGYTPESIRDFAERIGVAKADNMVDIAMLEHCLREDLNKKAQRVMAVLDPVKVIIDNYPEDKVEYVEAVNNPEDEGMGSRKMPFSRELYIERTDFMEDPPKKYFRLAPGAEVRFKNAYYIKCDSFVKDEAGNVTEIHCTLDPSTKGGWSEDGRKVKGTIHWVSARHAVKSEIRLYDRLFIKENPDDLGEGEDYKANLNPDSLKTAFAFIEPSVRDVKTGERVQFDRTGYFCMDTDSTEELPVFNRTVPLKDSWIKLAGK